MRKILIMAVAAFVCACLAWDAGAQEKGATVDAQAFDASILLINIQATEFRVITCERRPELPECKSNPRVDLVGYYQEAARNRLAFKQLAAAILRQPPAEASLKLQLLTAAQNERLLELMEKSK